MLKIYRLIKHDRYVEELCSILKPQYDDLRKNVLLYSKRNRLVAEIDVLASKEGIYDIYEVKCSHRITKARRQLQKIKKIVSSKSEVRNAYFFCGESGQIIQMEKNKQHTAPLLTH